MDEQQNQAEELNQQMTREQVQKWAITVLVASAKMAQAKGVFTLEEDSLVGKAVSVFVPSAPPAPEAQEEQEAAAPAEGAEQETSE